MSDLHTYSFLNKINHLFKTTPKIRKNYWNDIIIKTVEFINLASYELKKINYIENCEFSEESFKLLSKYFEEIYNFSNFPEFCFGFNCIKQFFQKKEFFDENGIILENYISLSASLLFITCVYGKFKSYSYIKDILLKIEDKGFYLLKNINSEKLERNFITIKDLIYTCDSLIVRLYGYNIYKFCENENFRIKPRLCDIFFPVETLDSKIGRERYKNLYLYIKSINKEYIENKKILLNMFLDNIKRSNKFTISSDFALRFKDIPFVTKEFIENIPNLLEKYPNVNSLRVKTILLKYLPIHEKRDSEIKRNSINCELENKKNSLHLKLCHSENILENLNSRINQEKYRKEIIINKLLNTKKECDYVEKECDYVEKECDYVEKSVKKVKYNK